MGFEWSLIQESERRKKNKTERAEGKWAVAARRCDVLASKHLSDLVTFRGLGGLDGNGLPLIDPSLGKMSRSAFEIHQNQLVPGQLQ